MLYIQHGEPARARLCTTRRQDDDIGDLPSHRDDLRALRARGQRGAEEPRGVTGVTVALVPGGESGVTVTSEAPLTEQAVAAALDEAGDYRLATG